ncbi:MULTISPECIES: hypothetical protein [unclassified Streptomyces]|uniref:hypothetical protein n=1 Tax=unclassified Streptomyces TaxID=2593676 RepID=UPI00224E8A44|nr:MULTISPECIES: hypothetical protein [unclassified Streptomyces]MCX5283368.1 hypothetical protein [Streptomyces sp. NBC_00198]WSD79677.1 hypothetical protein OHB33_27045 [Streptomyces sp. NBC_01558]
MTQPPKGSAAPPGRGAPTMPAVPPQSGPPVPPAGPGVPQGPPPVTTAAPAAPPRRTAWAEGVDRLRAAATTEPGRLRIIGALLALLVVAFGAVTALQMTQRSDAADNVLNSSQPLSASAADIYRSLADANTAAASGFLAGGQETQESRDQYDRDIRTASEKLVTAANSSDPGSASAATIADLNRLLPEYTGLVERARANNRQGFPLGGAYLRYANEKMQEQMLPKAQQLYTRENQRLNADYAEAKPYPWAAIALGLVALGALVWAQRRNYRRTNRVMNQGLAAATAASVVVLLWLAVGHTLARAGLDESYEHGVRSLNVLHDAQIASLKARGNENLTLVSRGAETKTLPDETTVDLYDSEFDTEMKQLTKGLAVAASLADDAAGEQPVRTATSNMKEWKARHKEARALDKQGKYQDALDKVIGSADKKPTGACFNGVDKSLTRALTHEQTEFKQAASDGLGAMSGLPVGAAVLAVLAAAGAVFGVGRRLSEYR